MTCNIYDVLFIFLFGVSGLLYNPRVEANGVTFKDCGGVYTEPKGVISTPSFPGPYPTPISCEWLIQAPHGKKIIIYFTQFYMKDSFYITEYEYYQDKSTYIGRHSLGRISWEHMLTSLAAYKPYVLIEFEVENIGNRHLRVIDHLLEVYGFNITYEILDKSADVTKQTCSVSECSFLGNCLVSGDFQSYQCNCFDRFFGENCQYGPYCDPDNGINQCTNGGRCKYFFGSLINQCECPPGYAGPYCEISEIPESANGRSAACLALQCKHLCDIDAEGNAYCMCYDGYKMHQDNGTCIPIARYRMDVSIELDQVQSMSDAMLEQKLEEAKPIILQIIEESGVSTVTKFGIKGLRRRHSGAAFEFYFYCKVSEVKLVRPALEALVAEGQVGIFQIKPQNPFYEESPELMIAEVSNFNMSPAIRGELLTLVCAAKGSQYMKFQWYKDEYQVDTSLTLRNTWISTVPDTVHGLQLSVLNIDNVGPLDKGQFICEVEDFGERQRGSADVTVDNYPRVELSPMSLSVLKGQMVSIKCMSPDISLQKISYEWFKNGEKIDSKGLAEYAEDMDPAGVRLVVPAVMEDAEYTCKVTNNAGSNNVSAYVSAIAPNETHLICKFVEGLIKWQNTSGGHFYIERCPTEQGGYARRKCICDHMTNECEWAEPNFAKCQSLDLIKVYDELQLLRSGYQQTTLKSVFDKLYLFTFPKKSVLIFSGDMDMVAHILKDFMSHLKNFPQLVNVDQPLSVTKLLQLISGILQQSSKATPDEKSIILVGPCIVHTLTTMFTGGLKSLEYSPQSPISTRNVDMGLKYVNLVQAEEDNLDINDQKSTNFIRYRREEPVTQDQVVVVKSRHLSDLLSYRHKANIKHKQIYTEMISAVHSATFYIKDKSSQQETSRVELTIDHDMPVSTGTQNRTVCLAWVYDPSNLHTGSWSNTTCSVIASTKMKTICNCPLPGHFTVAVVTSNYTAPETLSLIDNTIHIPLIVGYITSLFILVIACVIFIIACRHLTGDVYAVYFSFIWCLIGATVTSLLCLFRISNLQAIQGSLQIFLVFFYLSAQTHIVVEMFYVFIRVYNITTVQFTKLRFIFLSWGVPTVILIPIVILSKTVDNCLGYNLLCWFTTAMKHFYVYLLSSILFILTFLVFVCSSLVSLRRWKEECRYLDRITYFKQIVKSSIIYVFLILSTYTSLNLKNSSQSTQIVSHIVFYLCLCISVLVFRCIFDKQIRFIFERMCVTWKRSPDSNTRKSSSSFRAFMKPEKVSNVPLSQEEYNVSKYYDEVNRTKYTAERKRHLSLLLGSSVGGESGYASIDTKSASVSNSNTSSKESALSPVTATTEDRASDNGGNDSGIYEFQDAANYIPEEDNEQINHSTNLGVRPRPTSGPRDSSPLRVRILENGASNSDRNSGSKPVFFLRTSEEDGEDGTQNQDKRKTRMDKRVSKDEPTKSTNYNDLDQVIYYPHYKKSSALKSCTNNGSDTSTQDGTSEVAVLIHATQEQDSAEDTNISTSSHLLPRT